MMKNMQKFREWKSVVMLQKSIIKVEKEKEFLIAHIKKINKQRDASKDLNSKLLNRIKGLKAKLKSAKILAKQKKEIPNTKKFTSNVKKVKRFSNTFSGSKRYQKRREKKKSERYMSPRKMLHERYTIRNWRRKKEKKPETCEIGIQVNLVAKIKEKKKRSRRLKKRSKTIFEKPLHPSQSLPPSMLLKINKAKKELQKEGKLKKKNVLREGKFERGIKTPREGKMGIRDKHNHAKFLEENFGIVGKEKKAEKSLNKESEEERALKKKQFTNFLKEKYNKKKLVESPIEKEDCAFEKEEQFKKPDFNLMKYEKHPEEKKVNFSDKFILTSKEEKSENTKTSVDDEIEKMERMIHERTKSIELSEAEILSAQNLNFSLLNSPKKGDGIKEFSKENETKEDENKISLSEKEKDPQLDNKKKDEGETKIPNDIEEIIKEEIEIKPTIEEEENDSQMNEMPEKERSEIFPKEVSEEESEGIKEIVNDIIDEVVDDENKLKKVSSDIQVESKDIEGEEKTLEVNEIIELSNEKTPNSIKIPQVPVKEMLRDNSKNIFEDEKSEDNMKSIDSGLREIEKMKLEFEKQMHENETENVIEESKLQNDEEKMQIKVIECISSDNESPETTQELSDDDVNTIQKKDHEEHLGTIDSFLTIDTTKQQVPLSPFDVVKASPASPNPFFELSSSTEKDERKYNPFLTSSVEKKELEKEKEKEIREMDDEIRKQELEILEKEKEMNKGFDFNLLNPSEDETEKKNENEKEEDVEREKSGEGDNEEEGDGNLSVNKNSFEIDMKKGNDEIKKLESLIVSDLLTLNKDDEEFNKLTDISALSPTAKLAQKVREISLEMRDEELEDTKENEKIIEDLFSVKNYKKKGKENDEYLLFNKKENSITEVLGNSKENESELDNLDEEIEMLREKTKRSSRIGTKMKLQKVDEQLKRLDEKEKEVDISLNKKLEISKKKERTVKMENQNEKILDIVNIEKENDPSIEKEENNSVKPLWKLKVKNNEDQVDKIDFYGKKKVDSPKLSTPEFSLSSRSTRKRDLIRQKLANRRKRRNNI